MWPFVLRKFSRRQGRIQKIPNSGQAAYSIVGVFVMKSKVTLTFRNIELKSISRNDFRSKIVVLMVRLLENTRKNGGRGPLGPLP